MTIMNMRHIHRVALAALAFGGAVACNNDKLTELNRNPNSPEEVPATSIFTTAERNTVSRWLGNGYDLRGMEWVAQHLAEVQYPDEDAYKRLLAAAATTPAWFDNPYVSELEDLRQVIKRGVDAKDPGVYAPALVLRTLGFSYLTNTFGDIPYFSALAGDSVGASLSPKYDAQKDIYADFFKTLASASTALGT